MKEKNNDQTLIKKDSLKNLIGKYHKSKAVEEIEKAAKQSSVVELPISSLALFPLMDESNYSDLDLRPTMESASEKGIEIPIFLYLYNGKPTIVNGVKRFLVAKKLGIKTIKAIYLNGSLDLMLQYVLENLLNDNSNGLVLSYAYKVLLDDFSFKEKDIRDISGLSHGQVNNYLRLNKLCPEVKNMILKGDLTTAKARLLVSFSEMNQKMLARRFSFLPVRDCEALSREYHSSTEEIKEPLTSIKRERGRIIVTSENEKLLDEIEIYLKGRID